MAKRPIYIPIIRGAKIIKQVETEFKWFPGFSVSQKQKSIESLHSRAIQQGWKRILEISTKSSTKAGVSLSAFNLNADFGDLGNISVEAAFQGSKVFLHGGPFTELYQQSPVLIKKDPRLYESGKLLCFQFLGEKWSLRPRTAFYDWIYMSALKQNPELSETLLEYDAFTDIEFNPKKSINCQAHSAALFVSLSKRNLLSILDDKKSYMKYLTKNISESENQIKLKLGL